MISVVHSPIFFLNYLGSIYNLLVIIFLKSCSGTASSTANDDVVIIAVAVSPDGAGDQQS